MTLKFKSSISALMVPTAFTIIILTLAAFPLGLSSQYSRMVFSPIGVSIALGILYLVIKMENASFHDYQLVIDKGTFKKFFIGLLCALILGGGMIISHALFSDLQFTSNFVNLNSFLLLSLVLIPLALMEELIFRSFLLKKLHKTYNIWIAQIIIALLFAFYHVVGAQGQSLSSALIGPGIWSFIFVALALCSNGISMPTGFHYGLNLILAAIGDKTWIAGLWEIKFKETPSEAALQSHETFGIVLHSLLLIIGIVATIYLNKRMSQAKNAHS